MSAVLPGRERRLPVEADLDDVDAYVATFDAAERRQLLAAEAAIDIAILLHRARERRGLSRAAAARLAGLQRQAVSRIERPAANPRFETIRSYLSALGYALELRAIDPETGETAAAVVLPPQFLRDPAPAGAPDEPGRRGSHRRPPRASAADPARA